MDDRKARRKMNSVRQRTEAFSFQAVRMDKIGRSVGFWNKERRIGRAVYSVSIVAERDKDDEYTIASYVRYPHEDNGTLLKIAGHVHGLAEAVKLANRTYLNVGD